MGNIQEKVHRLVTCCRMCAALGLGEVSIELNGRFTIEQNGRVTYRFNDFNSLERFLEDTLLHKARNGKSVLNKSARRRLEFLYEKQRIAKTDSKEIRMWSDIR